FYRLGVVSIYIPPLRERKEDIFLLTQSFIKEYNVKMNKNIKGLDKSVEDLFMEYSWPGNVRELKHIIESSFNFAEGNYITKEQGPDHIRFKEEEKNSKIDIDDKFSLNSAVNDYEKKHIQLALQLTSTLNDAAKLLKISRQTLKYKMDSYGIEVL